MRPEAEDRWLFATLAAAGRRQVLRGKGEDPGGNRRIEIGLEVGQDIHP